MVELRLLRYFVAVAETEHIGHASRRLHVSQSPLSRQIRQLEEATGLTLFERERQRLRITRAGAWMLGRARLILANVAALERDAARLSRGETERRPPRGVRQGRVRSGGALHRPRSGDDARPRRRGDGDGLSAREREHVA